MFVVKKDDKVVLADNDKERLETTLKHLPNLQGLDIEESNEDWQLINGSWRIGGLTNEELSAKKRSERDAMLKSTDVYMLPDFPISDEKRELYKQYRQYLRDLPEAESFPDVEVMSFDDWNSSNN